MSRVQMLEKSVAERIAAGEVVERPASVIKELTENSLDAAASHICVEIENGGTTLMQITDDGCGMSREDASLAIQRFCTSKIRLWEDMDDLATLGFRGEALPSVAAVSRMEIRTAESGAEEGTLLSVEGAGIPVVKPAPALPGTRITVRDLFYNTPARLKFLRSPAAETAQITDMLGRMACAWPEVRFEYKSNRKTVFDFPAGMAAVERLAQLWKLPVDAFVSLSAQVPGAQAEGWVVLPEFARSTRSYQLFVMNGRIIRSQHLSQAMQEGYVPLLERGRFPVGMIRLHVEAGAVDVNVHPNKLEVRFADPRPLFSLVYKAVADALARHEADSVSTRHWQMATDKVVRSESAEPANKEEAPLNRQAVSEPLPAATPSERLDRLMGGLRQHMGTAWQGRPLASTQERALSQAELEGGESEPPASYELPAEKMLPGTSAVRERSVSCVPAPVAPETQTHVDTPAGKSWSSARTAPQVLAQLYNTFIVALMGGELWVIDQHTAHERLNYENLGHLAPLDSRSQGLLIPENIELLSISTADFVREHLPDFAHFGFELEHFGGQSFVLRGVPLALTTSGLARVSSAHIARCFKDLAEELAGTEYADNCTIKGSVAERLREKMRALMSCKAAVKAGEPLSFQEMEALLTAWLRVEHSPYCPHGRPTRIKLDKIALERLFHR